MRDYGLDSPLWAFVGSKVTGNVVYKEGGKTRSDVLNVIRFLHRFLKNDENWAIHTIERILSSDSGLSDDGIDVFHDRLNYLRNLNETPAQIYTAILQEVFHANISGALHLQEVRNAQGEIALKTTHGSETLASSTLGILLPSKSSSIATMRALKRIPKMYSRKVFLTTSTLSTVQLIS